MLWWMWTVPAQAVDVCHVGCPFTSIRQAVLAVGPGEEVEFLVLPGNYVETESIVMPADATIRLLGQGAVTLTNAGQGPVILASGEGSVLTLDTFTLTAVNDRILEVTAGQVKLLRSVLYTMGVVDEGGSVRVGPGATFVADDTLFIDSVATSAGGHLLAREATVELVNCRFSGGYARHGGSISLEGDTSPAMVTISGSTFEQNLAAEAGGAISVVGNVSLVVESTRFEDNTADRGGALADYPVPQTSPTIQIGTSVFESNTADGNGGALSALSGTWTLADSTFSRNSAIDGGALWIGGGGVSMDRGLLCENVARNAGGAVSSATSVQQIWFNNRMIENIAERGGAVDHTGQRLELRHSNLLGNSAPVGGAVRSDSEVLVYDSIVGWTDGGTALVGVEVTERYNAFWRNVAGDIQEGTSAAPLGEGDLRSDPRLERYLPGSGCDAADDYYSWYGPLRGAAYPLDQPNPDGSAADIGAFGGQVAPTAQWTDTDGDLFPPLYDCVEGDDSIHPEAIDEPYDGLDRNCDMADDSDADGDGFQPPEDCDDSDAAIYPGAIELPDKGDQNCDGRADADGDGYSPPDDCNDGDDRIHPGATEDAGPAELDCKAPADIPRPLEPRTCSTVGGSGVWLVGLLLLIIRKRS
jgi:predicted outer membrane repeat protein